MTITFLCLFFIAFLISGWLVVWLLLGGIIAMVIGPLIQDLINRSRLKYLEKVSFVKRMIDTGVIKLREIEDHHFILKMDDDFIRLIRYFTETGEVVEKKKVYYTSTQYIFRKKNGQYGWYKPFAEEPSYYYDEEGNVHKA